MRKLEATARSWDERTLLTVRHFPATICWGPPGTSWDDPQNAARRGVVHDRFRKADVGFMDWSRTVCPGPNLTPGPIDGRLTRSRDFKHSREHMFIASCRAPRKLRELCELNPVNNCKDTEA